jgi:uracil-DNA glycosylase family 4
MGPPQPAHRSLNSVHAAIVSCDACPRLRAYCTLIGLQKRRAYREETYWARPVPGFGDPEAEIIVLGLAPAAHGANRTGRMFTGDGVNGSGDFLMGALYRAGFANIPTSRHVGDGLVLRNVFITASIRCAPPDNTPTPDEIRQCRAHLDAELALLTRARVIVCLGKIAFDSYFGLLKRRGQVVSPLPRFAHGAVYRPANAPVLIGCYHPSRQNTHTGRLTARMMDDVFRRTAREIARDDPNPPRARAARSGRDDR